MTKGEGTIAIAWRPAGSFHHVGFVVASIVETAPAFAESLGAEWDGEIVHDPLQRVRVSFLRSTKSSADPLFELIEPAGEGSPVASFLKRQGGIHHVCYVTPDLEAELQAGRSKGTVVVRPPMPAAAFGGRRIAWVYTKHKLLIEYLEQ